MNIGELSKRTALSSKMIRYYEQIGLIQAAQRSAAGYRLYQEHDVDSLKFIQHAKSLGFNLNQIKDLLSLRQNSQRQSLAVKQLALQHIEDLHRQMQSIQQMIQILEDAVAQCPGDESSSCSILQKIESGGT